MVTNASICRNPQTERGADNAPGKIKGGNPNRQEGEAAKHVTEAGAALRQFDFIILPGTMQDKRKGRTEEARKGK